MKKIIIIMALLLLPACGDRSVVEIERPEVSREIETEEIETEERTEKETEDEKLEEADPIASIDMSLEPNELGEIMILMYHGIGQEELEWQRSAENFRKDLEYMYQNGYRMISLNDYAKGQIYTEAGYTPIILTFDDGRQNNFN
ncbi:MAG: hypothetical protein GX339_06300, partial [Tissierellia bacterium]|nr:hypothetical protein [Tissierellia bacterium]